MASGYYGIENPLPYVICILLLLLLFFFNQPCLVAEYFLSGGTGCLNNQNGLFY